MLQEAYRRWTCSSLFPHFVGDGVADRIRVRPCLKVCQDVEQQCPYMLPGDRDSTHLTQYAGEPTFLCLGKEVILVSFTFHSVHSIFVVIVFKKEYKDLHRLTSKHQKIHTSCRNWWCYFIFESTEVPCVIFY